MKIKVDYLLVGTGAAPLLAAQRLANRGESVAILNPDPDFFLENSELPLDLLSFETTTTDLNRRFSNNTPEQIYRDLIPEFPGAVETWKEEDERSGQGDFKVADAPWIRSRHRLWVAPAKSARVDYLENLYLRSLDLGWKPKWLEGIALAKRFPGFSTKNAESRGLENWVGFLGPRFGDIDAVRYRSGLLEFVRERLGRENIHTSAHILNIDHKSVRFHLPSGLPHTIEVGRSILYFWTPRMERILKNNLEKYQPRALGDFIGAAQPQLWEEWDILSRDPVYPGVVAHLEGARIWSYGEGLPPRGGWNRVKVMRRAHDHASNHSGFSAVTPLSLNRSDSSSISASMLSESSFQEVSRLVFQFLGWERFTVRGVTPRTFYRWSSSTPIEYESDGIRTLILQSCDGPLHWIAQQVRRTIDGI
jgi:hypothetical protein